MTATMEAITYRWDMSWGWKMQGVDRTSDVRVIQGASWGGGCLVPGPLVRIVWHGLYSALWFDPAYAGCDAGCD
jgi:hypothetical protein